MNAVEIESLLQAAGYEYSIVEGNYQTVAESEPLAYDSTAIADELEIPLEDLIRWEEEQRQADTSGV